MKLFNKLAAVACLVFALHACDTDLAPLNGYVEPTQEGTSTYIMKGYESSQKGFNVFEIEKSGFVFYLKDKAIYGSQVSFLPAGVSRLDAMTTVPEQGEWKHTAEVVENQCYWVRYGQYTVTNFMKFRIAYVNGNNVCIEHATVDYSITGPNMNSNYAFLKDFPSALNLEIPAIKETDGVYREHYVNLSSQRIMNFATSWNVALRHAAWQAFSFDKVTAQDKVKRTNAWAWDTAYDFESMGGVEEADHKSDGFDKGHMVASEDRVYCKEANEQTFFYTNISAQIGVFNQNYWAALEDQIQAWGRSVVGSTYDKLYVVKGATLDKPLANFTGNIKANDGKFPITNAEGKTINGLFVPLYYYMALLAEKDGVYQAIAFYVPHKEDLPKKPSAEDFQVFAMSIHDLEQQTGIDFFCNLPDSIEAEVEASYDKSAWSWK